MRYLVLLLGLVLTSTVVAKDKIYALTTASSGVVSSITVKTGDSVKQGQLLLTLDQRVFTARLKESDARVNSRLLDMKEAEKQLTRAEELYERTVLSDHDLDVAKIEFAKSNSDYQTALREQAESQYLLDYSQLLAPINGKIKRVIAFQGMVVNNQLKNTVLIEMKAK